MNKIFLFFIAVFIFFASNAQVKDSVKIIPTSKFSNGINLTKVIVKIDLLDFDKLVKIKDSTSSSRYVTIDKKLLDSLLSPFYIISVVVFNNSDFWFSRVFFGINGNMEKE